MSAKTALLLVLATVALTAPAVAVAERPARPAELAAIDRLLRPSASSLHDRLVWVHTLD